jgi:methylglutamate dehydrogenase subunit B
MLIPCPYCGPRDLIEFTVQGEDVPRPALVDGLDGEASRAAFVDAVYLRDNPAGSHRELWYHGIGCQCWMVVERDTRTHAITHVELAMETGS